MTAGHDQRPAAQAGYDLLADVERGDPVAVRAVVGYPSVGAWAGRTWRGLREPAMAGAEPGGLAAVAAAAAIRAGFPAEIAVLATSGQVTLPSLGAATVPDANATVRIHADGTEIRSAGAPIESTG